MDKPKYNQHQLGFTLIELIIVIVILGVLSIVAAPRLINISTEAKINKIENIATQMRTTNKLVKSKAIVKGLVAATVNTPQNQIDRIVEFEFGRVEVDFRSLCPEAIGELGDRLEYRDFLNISTGDDIIYQADNQYVRIGFDIPASGLPISQGCYARYNSFTTNCDVTTYTATC